MNWRGLAKFLRFSVLHSLRDMWRNRGRTMFALACVATGVAAVVALRSLAFMVGDKLTTSLAELNRSDIRVYASRGVPELIDLSGQRTPIFNADALAVMREWASDEGVELTVGRLDYFASILPVVDGEGQTAAPGQVLFIEPAVYPFYDTIFLREPAGLTLKNFYAAADSEAAGTLDDPRPVVISNNLTRESSLKLQIGDVIRIGAAETYFEVRGIASSTAETVLSNPAAAVLGDYVYLPFGDLALIGEPILPDQVFIRVPLGHDIAAAESSLIHYLQAAFETDRDFEKELNRASVPELEKQNSETADIIDDLILTMGLSSLLIGGIGIINTMLVVVSRRTLEVAVLKTLGLKAYRVTFLFLVEALLLGVIGSLIGITLGVALSYAIQDVGEEAFKLTLEWRLYPEAMVSGLFLGVLMTGLFGFLPTLIAGQVRPAVVLRPNEAQMPAAGLVQTLFTLVLMIIVMGLMVSSIVEGAIDYGPVYMIAGGGALVGLFAGVIVANTRLGQPIPKSYRFRLSRRFDRLEKGLTGTGGRLAGWLPVAWTSADSNERGREAITAGLRGFRQLVLLYGSLAVGAAVASGIGLVGSEIWLPFGIGDDKPPGDIARAIADHDWAWIAGWAVLTAGIGYLIRRYARRLVSVLAMGSLGVTLGGALGWLGGQGLEAALADRGVWQILAEMSTGIVLVEGAMALMGAVYIAYWLLIWVVGKLPNILFMGVVGVIMLSLASGVAAALALIGPVALIAVLVGIAVMWVLGRPQFPVNGYGRLEQGDTSNQSISPVNILRSVTQGRGAAAVMISVGAMSGGFLLVEIVNGLTWHLIVGIAAVLLVGLWWYFRRVFAIDGRLILREMGGRRGRLASTLLGLSVGIAGLSVVSLTTGAVSRLLEVQLGENAEGNLLIIDPTSQYAEQVTHILTGIEGVQQFSQVTSYNAILLEVNGEVVQTWQQRRAEDEQANPHENSSFELTEQGVPIALTVRKDLTDVPDYKMKGGRAFRPDDAGQSLILMRESFVTEEFGIRAGDRLQFLLENDPGEADDVYLQFRVIGIISRQSEQTGLEDMGNLSVLPPDVLPGTVKPDATVTIAMIDESDDVYMDRAMVALSDVPGVITFELSMLTQLVQSLLDQLRAIPTLVAWLALVAGTAIIANTVALATQERRRQIGVMKAVGLKGGRVLGMLMVENGLLGLIAGLIGTGVGFLLTVILVLASRNPDELSRTIEFDTIGWLIVMSIVVAMGAALLSAWSAAAEKPMNVLRYE